MTYIASVSTTVVNQTLTTARMTTAPSTVVTTNTVTFAPTGYDQLGFAMTVQPTNWVFTSGTPATATINSSGVATGVALGTTNITASSGGITTPAVVLTDVAQVPTTVNVSPTSFTIDDVSTEQLTATVLDQAGGTIASPTVTWSSGSPSVATVNSSGLVTAQSPGTAIITATSGLASGPSTGTVIAYTPVATTLVWIDTPPQIPAFGATRFSRAQINDQEGVPMASQAGITYTSATTAKVTVGSTTGVCTGVANGTSVISALYTGVTTITQTATVAQVVDHASISPATVTLSPSGTQQFTLVAYDSNSNIITSPPTPTWYAGNNADGSPFGTVTTGGLFTAPASGTGYINATYPDGVGSQFGGITVSGVAPSLDHMDVTLNTYSVTTAGPAPTISVALWANAGETIPFTGTVSLSYVSNTPATATINSSTGVITLVAMGSDTFTVTDSISTKSATSPTLSVTTAVTSVTPIYNGASAVGGALMFAGTSYTFTAQDQSGNPLNGSVGSWSSTDPTNCPINASTGVCTPNAAACGATVSYTHTVSGKIGSIPITGLKGGYTPIHGDDFSGYANDAALRAHIYSNVISGTYNTPTPTGSSSALYNDGFNQGLASLDSAIKFMGHQTLLLSFPDTVDDSGQLVSYFPNVLHRGWQYRIERYSPGGDVGPYGTSVPFTCGDDGNPAKWPGGNAANKAAPGFTGGNGNWRAQVGYNSGSSDAGDCNNDWYLPDSIARGGYNVEVSPSTPNGKLDFDGKWRVRILLVEQRAPCLWSMRQWLAPLGSLPTLVGGVQAEVAFEAASSNYYLSGSCAMNLSYNLVRPAGFILQKNIGKWETVSGDTYGDPYGLLGAQPTPTISSLSISSITHGTTGNTLVITGTGFNANTGVVFSNSGITVSPRSTNTSNDANMTVTATTITIKLDCISGATTGAGTIAVTNFASQVTTATQAFSVA